MFNYLENEIVVRLDDNLTPSKSHLERQTAHLSPQELCLLDEGSDFLFNMTSEHEGCTVKCFYLTNSRRELIGYFDKTRVHRLAIQEKQMCPFKRSNEFFCYGGLCLNTRDVTAAETPTASHLPNLFMSSNGTVRIHIYSGIYDYPHELDGTPHDTRVTIEIDRKNVSSTKVVNDTRTPFFDHEFQVENVRPQAVFILRMIDDNTYFPTYLGFYKFTPEDIVRNGWNGRPRTYSLSQKCTIVATFSWIPSN